MANKHTVEDSSHDQARLTETARTAPLSDGVFAITVTLLVLEIHRPEKRTATAEYFRTQRLRPVIGVALYGLAVPVVWFLGPAVGLSFFVIMIIFHAVASEGLQEGPLGRLSRMRRVDRR